MTLDGSGNLGIGILTPTYKLHVNGNANIVGEYYKNGSVFIPDNAYNLSGSPNITVGTINASGTITAPTFSGSFSGSLSGNATSANTITASGYTIGDFGIMNSAPVNIGTGSCNLHIGRCGAGAYYVGLLSLAQDFNNGSSPITNAHIK